MARPFFFGRFDLLRQFAPLGLSKAGAQHSSSSEWHLSPVEATCSRGPRSPQGATPYRSRPSTHDLKQRLGLDRSNPGLIAASSRLRNSHSWSSGDVQPADATYALSRRTLLYLNGVWQPASGINSIDMPAVAANTNITASSRMPVETPPPSEESLVEITIRAATSDHALYDELNIS